MIIKFSNYITEVCDGVKVEGSDDDLSVSFRGARPFIIQEDEIYIGEEGDTHLEMYIDKTYNLYETEYDLQGRVYLEDRIVSFWDIENLWDKDDYDFLFKLIADAFNIKSWSNWRIDLLLLPEYTDLFIEKEYFIYTSYQDEEYVLIPVEEFIKNKYKTKKDVKAYNLHNLKSKEKYKALKDLGYKSKSSQWKDYQKPFENNNI